MVANLKKIIQKFEALRLIGFSKYKKLNGETAVYRKFNLKYWFVTKHYPQRMLWRQYDVKRNGSSCKMILSTHSYNHKTL